jgi:hypothetical protein
MPTVVDILEKPGRCFMPVDLCALSDGRLLCAYREGEHHTSHDGRIAMLVSRDDGESWGDEQILCTPPGGDDYRDPSITELASGKLILTFYSWDSRGQGSNGKDGCFVLVSSSRDHGRTWSRPRAVPADPFDFMTTTEHCVQLPGGRVLMPVHSGSCKRTSNGGSVLCSDDQGETWRYLSTIHEFYRAPRAGWFGETAIVRTRRGKLVAVMRSDRGMVQSVSRDDGVTWGESRYLAGTSPETQPSLSRLSDGRLLLCYGDRGPLPRLKAYDYSIVARVSVDEGISWDAPIVLAHGLEHWDMGYPTTVEVGGNKLVTVFWRSTPHPSNPWPDGWEYRLSAARWDRPE